MTFIKILFGIIIFFLGSILLVYDIKRTWKNQGKYKDPLESHMDITGTFGFALLIVFGLYLIVSAFY